jgi:hypothetical protein
MGGAEAVDRHNKTNTTASFAIRRRSETRLVARISKETSMKLPRRQFLHLAAGAAALPVVFG